MHNPDENKGLVCKNVFAQYGKLVVCRDISLVVAPGELLGVVGPNGAGKTSLVGAINGTVSSRGSIMLGDCDLGGKPGHQRQRHGLATVPDDRGLFPPLTVAENIRLGAQYVAKAERADAIEEAVERFPFLKKRMSTNAGSLSGGEQQMLAVAKNLAGKPKALLLDEPSQGLAPIIIDELVKVFSELRNSGLPIMLVEQNHGLVERVATRIAVVVGGSIALEAGPSALSDRDNIAKLFLQKRKAA